jgi:hypothetical protein
MARKQLMITVDKKGRDIGKVFLINEMPASQSEKWAARCFFAMAKSGVEIPENIAESGLAGIAALGIKALGGVNFDDAEILLNEMFRCISIVPDPLKQNIVRGLIDDDIEEIGTRLMLRKEVFNLHVSFFTDD